MSYRSVLVRGLGLTAGLIYLFDGKRGRRRRDNLRRVATGALGRIDEALEGVEDLSQQARTLIPQAQGLLRWTGRMDRGVARRLEWMGGLLASPTRLLTRERPVNVALPILAVLGGAGLGAGIMFLTDPERGRARRALLRDKVVSFGRKAGEELQDRGRDLSNRTRGVVAKTASHLKHEEVPDDKLIERVRSKLGHLVSNPGAIEVSVNQGQVVLGGSLPPGEIQKVVSALSAVPGVKGVDNRLKPAGEKSASGTTAQS